MYKITRYFNNQKKQYPVFPQEEADDLGLSYRHWILVEEDGWGISDDGYVMRCHNIYRMDVKKEGRYTLQFTFTVGRPMAQFRIEDDTMIGDPTFDFLPYLEKGGGFSHSTPTTWQEHEARKTRTKNAVWLYAHLFIARRGRLTDEDWGLIGEVHRPDQDQPARAAKRLFRQDTIKDMADDEVARILNENGETPQDLVQKYNDLFEMCLEAGHSSTGLELIRDLRDMHGMKPQEKQVETGFSFEMFTDSDPQEQKDGLPAQPAKEVKQVEGKENKGLPKAEVEEEPLPEVSDEVLEAATSPESEDGGDA
jgi:hypothetical protein